MNSTLTADRVTSLKVSELKAALSSRGLETNGIKSALQKRLLAAVQAGADDGMDVEDATPKNEVEIDEATRYSGTVAKFFKRKGFGMIIPEGKTEADKDDLIFVHWRQIQSNDEWPALENGQKVEYYLGKNLNPKNPKKTMFAAKVTLEGGNTVTTEDKRIWPDRSERFQGTVKFFHARKGFGFVVPKEDITFDGTEFKKESKKDQIYVAREDIKTTAEVDTSPSLKNDSEIEFTLYKREEDKDGKTKYGAGDVTLVGGAPLGPDDFKAKPTPEELKERRKARQAALKKKKKAQKRKAGKAFKMGGMTMIPMGGQMMQPQMVMMNGQAFMMMPQQMAGMGGFKFPGQKNKKRRKKNKKGKN